MSPLMAGGAAAAAVLAGAYAHEYTHVAAFRALGGRAKVRHLDLTVEWAMPDELGTWRDRLGALAPALVGWLVAAVALATGSVPEPGIETLWMWAGWGIYTLHGGLSDYSMGLARGGALLDLEDHWRRLIAAVGCIAVAFVGWTLHPEPDHYAIQFFFTYVYTALYLGGMALLALSIRAFEPKTAPAAA